MPSHSTKSRTHPRSQIQIVARNAVQHSQNTQSTETLGHLDKLGRLSSPRAYILEGVLTPAYGLDLTLTPTDVGDDGDGEMTSAGLYNVQN